MQKIYYLVSSNNIYCNLQRLNKPSSLDFDVSNPRKWAPLNNKTAPKLMPVQDEVLDYTAPNFAYAREVERELAEALIMAIRDNRPRSPTTFRSDVATKIMHSIDQLEQAKMKGCPAAVNANDLFPESIAKTRATFGFTLHGPYTTIEDAIDTVLATKIHCNQNPRVEFAVGVQAFSYPGNVISLWIFVCSLVPNP